MMIANWLLDGFRISAEKITLKNHNLLIIFKNPIFTSSDPSRYGWCSADCCH
jgi:hypothetical protein